MPRKETRDNPPPAPEPEPGTLRIQSSQGTEQESDIQSIVAWGAEHGWHTLVLAPTDPVRPKGLVIVQPGRPQGILKVLVDVEPTSE